MPVNSKVDFPLLPDEAYLEVDNRFLVGNQQLITNNPKPSDEEALLRYSRLVDRKDFPMTIGQQSSRERYNSVKRRIGDPLAPVNTTEKFYKKSAVEESKERAKRAAVPPRPLKGYTSPLERVKNTLHAEKPVPVETPEYRKRALKNRDLDPVTPAPSTNTSSKQQSLFSREGDNDYFARKRNNLYDTSELNLGLRHHE